MAQVTVTMNGRIYRLACGEGEEARVLALAEHVREKVDQLAANYGQAGDDRLLLMAAILTADELFDALESLDAAQAAGGEDPDN